MKKLFQDPTINVEVFAATDVITASNECADDFVLCDSETPGI